MSNFLNVIKSAILGVLIFGISIFILSCGGGVRNISEKDAYDRVNAEGKIRVGYISYPPSFIKDPNTGQMSGIFYEVLQEAGKNLDLKIDYTEEVAWGTMIEAVKSNRVDLVSTGIWPTSARGKSADFSTPLYYSTVRAYSAANDNRFDGNIDAVNNADVRIAVVDGEMSSIIARTDFPIAQAKSLTQSTDIAQLLLEVATKKADLTFVEPAVASEYMNANPGKIKEVVNVKPLRIFPNVMMVAKGEQRLLSTLNTAINELINNGFVDKVIQKYEKYPGSFQRVAVPYKESNTQK